MLMLLTDNRANANIAPSRRTIHLHIKFNFTTQFFFVTPIQPLLPPPFLPHQIFTLTSFSSHRVFTLTLLLPSLNFSEAIKYSSSQPHPSDHTDLNYDESQHKSKDDCNLFTISRSKNRHSPDRSSRGGSFLWCAWCCKSWAKFTGMSLTSLSIIHLATLKDLKKPEEDSDYGDVKSANTAKPKSRDHHQRRGYARPSRQSNHESPAMAIWDFEDFDRGQKHSDEKFHFWFRRCSLYRIIAIIGQSDGLRVSHSFLNEFRNHLNSARNYFFERFQQHSLIVDRFSHIDDHRHARRSIMMNYFAAEERFLDLFLLLMHWTGDLSPRRRELIQVLWCNAESIRNLFLSNGLIVMIIDYHKIQWRQSTRPIARFFPPAVSELLIKYFIFVSSFVQFLRQSMQDFIFSRGYLFWTHGD